MEFKTVGEQPTKEKGTCTGECAHTCESCKQICTDGHVQPTDYASLDVMMFRNRSEVEACLVDKSSGEIVRDRIPVTWRARENTLDYLSVSKISAYEQCPACFYQQYLSEEGASEDSGNFFTKFGSILHEVVELASKYYRDNGIVVNPVSLFDEVWAAHDLSDFDAYLEAKNLVQDHFARSPIEARPYHPVLIEEEWRGELGGCTFGLVLDYAGVMKDDPKHGILLDYKSNRMPFTPGELDSSFQLRTYEIVLRRDLMPEIEKWTSGYEMFRYGWQQCPERTPEDLENAEQYIANVWKQVISDNTWEPKLNNYCGYRSCRFTCKKYADYVNNPKRYIDAFGVADADYGEIERQRTLMATYEKISKTRKDEAAGILKEAIQRAAAEGHQFVLDGEVLELYANPTQSYRYYDTRNILLTAGKLDLLDDCLSIGKTKMDAKLKLDPALRLQLAGCMNTSYAQAYITKHKKK